MISLMFAFCCFADEIVLSCYEVACATLWHQEGDGIFKCMCAVFPLAASHGNNTNISVDEATNVIGCVV